MNPGVTTVGGTLGEAISQVLGHPVELVCAGRTDRGVHAWGQVVSFEARGRGLDVDDLLRSTNALCAPAIVVRDAQVVEPEFDARRSAVARSYRYLVLNRPVPDPFLAPTAWHVPTPLDVGAMRLACDPLIGEHDFSSFCRRPGGAEADVSLTRRVIGAQWEEVGDVLRLDIEASSFCHQMVRSLVGTMVEMGRGRKRAGDMLAIREARDRSRAGQPAPPHGLCLWAVRYDEAISPGARPGVPQR